MGQKVNPIGMRLGIVKDHTSVWYADKKSYPEYLLNDLEVREFLRKRLAQASISRIEIERPAQTARITIHTARPGIVIGKKGEDVERLRVELARMMGVPVHVNIEEIRKPEMDALLQERWRLEQDLREAISLQELGVHYQPVYCVETGRVVGLF